MTDGEHYLGDGAFASFDGFGITVSTDRDGVEHYVCLEPEVFAALMKFAMTVGWLKTEGEWDA